MKAGFSFTKEFVPTWNGNRDLPDAEQLKAQFKMPTVEDVFAVLDRLRVAGFEKGEAADQNLDKLTTIAKECGVYVPKYITLTGNDDFSVEDVVKYPPFFALASELLFALVEYAQPNGNDVKN